MIISKYDSTGRYISVGSETVVPPGVAVPPTVGDSEYGIFYGSVDIHTQYHDLNTGTPQFMGERPSSNHQFNYLNKQWEDCRSLQEHQAAKWTGIKQARDLAEFGKFTYNGMVFDGDVNAQRRLAGYISISKAAIAAGTAFEAPFTLANNTEVVLTAQDFVGIELAKVTAVATAFAQAAALRLQIDAVTSIGQLALINWNSQP